MVHAYTHILVSVSLSPSSSFPTHSYLGVFLASSFGHLTNKVALLKTWAYPHYLSDNCISYFKLDSLIPIYLHLTSICMQTKR